MQQSRSNLMPHPERACEPLLGSDDGKWIFKNMIPTLLGEKMANTANWSHED